MQPYEFGYVVGNHMAKQAAWGDTADIAGNIALGDSVIGGFNPLGDPNSRGVVQDIALYSNPFTGVPTAVNDTARHLYNGNWGSAGMSVLNGALSFLPGFGFAAKGLTSAARAGATAAGKAGLKTTAKVLGAADNFGTQGAKMMTGANQAAGRQVQKVLPLSQGKGVAGRMYNAAVQNPMQGAQSAIMAHQVSQLPGAISAMRANAQNVQPTQYGSFAAGPAGVAY